jgi:hypothetical protein
VAAVIVFFIATGSKKSCQSLFFFPLLDMSKEEGSTKHFDSAGKRVVIGQGKLGDQLIARKTKKEQKGESTIRKRRVFMHKRVLLVAQRKREQKNRQKLVA